MQLWAASTGRDLEAVDQIGRLFLRHNQGELIHLSSDLIERAGLLLEDQGQIYAYFRDVENTLSTLDRAVRERSGARNALSMRVNPLYDFLRDDPRFLELMRQAGFDSPRL
jgi:hypothetical protein